jgi:glycosyltransferase involved in cell wall biosynthesis
MRLGEKDNVRIAHICGFAWEPKGTVRARAFPLAVELVRHGHEVTMFLVPYDNPAESGKQRKLEGVHIVNVEVGQRPGLRHVPLLLKRLCNAVQRYSPDVVHVFKPKGYAGAACTWLLLKGAYAVALDSDDWEGWGGFNELSAYPWLVKEYIDRQEKGLMRRAPVVTVASRALEQRAIELRGSSEGVIYLPNGGVSRGEALIRERVLSSTENGGKGAFGLPDAPIIFYSGHFNPDEDAMFFCRTAALAARRTNSTVVFVGDGPELPRVKEFFARQDGVAVSFFPRLPYEQFVRLLATSDVAAFPYPDNPIHRSKCSVRVMDYMSAGKPVLTSAVGQNKDYIVDGESGILAPAGDEARFTEELERLLGDPELRARLGRNAMQRMKDKFAWEGPLVERCLMAYQQLSTR